MRTRNSTPSSQPYVKDAIHKLYDARDILRAMRVKASRPAGLRAAITGDLYDRLDEVDEMIIEAQQLLFTEADLKDAEGRRKRRIPR